MRTNNRWVCEHIKATFTPASNRKTYILDTIEAVTALYRLWDKSLFHTREQIYAIYLNDRFRVIGYAIVNTGNRHCVEADLAYLFKQAWDHNAAKIIISHNHPNGTLEPSVADMEITRDIQKLAKLHAIQLFDHIILAAGDYYSFSESKNL